jgi:tetratricopeptide (TPR) repeat protein
MVLRLLRLALPLAVMLFLTATCSVGQTASQQQEKRAAAIAFEQQGSLAESETAWRDVLSVRPSDAEAFAHLGLLEAHQEHYKEAIVFYRKAMAINPAMPGLRLNLGLSLFKSGEMKEAIQIFTQLQKSERQGSQEEQRLSTLNGMAHFGLGEYAAAVPYLRKAAKSDPTNLGFRMALAESCLSSKQYQCVLDVYREIVNLNAESAEADMLAGEAQDEMLNTEGAIEQFRAAVKADPKVPNVHFGLGYLLWKQSKYEEAAPEFQAELENIPDSPQALTFLADCYIQFGKPADAVPLAEKAIQLDPSIAKAHLELGIIYAGSDRKQDALREFQTAVKLAPAVADAHWRLGRLYQSLGRKEEAKAEFDKTSSLHKAENDSIFTKLKAAQDKAKPAGTP